MVFLRLENDKILKMNQTMPVYKGENKADVIKVDIADNWKYLSCYLNILSSVTESGDIIPIQDKEEIIIEGRFLLQKQNLIIWIEMRDEEQIIKSSEITLKVNEHNSIEEIITEENITFFDKILQKASSLNEETKQLKQEVENLTPSYVTSDEIKNLFN